MSTMPQIILAGQQHPIQGPADWKKEALTIGEIMARQKIAQQQAVGLSQENEMRQRQIDEAKALQEAVRKNYAGAPAPAAPGATPGAGLPAPQPAPQAPAGQPLTVGQLGAQTAPQAPPAPPPGQTTVAAVAGQPAAAAQPSGGLPDAAVQGIANAALKGETMPTSFGHPGVNYDGVINDLMRGGHLNAAQSISQNLFKWRSDQLKLQQEQVKLAADKASRLGALAGSVKDQQSFDYAIGQAAREGAIDLQTAQSLMKEGYTPRAIQLLNQFKTAATTAEQQIQNNRADLDYAQKVVEFKHKVATEAPKSALEWMKLGGTLFTPDMTTNQITAALGSMKAMGAPQEIVDRFDQAVATSGAKGAAMLGMTPEQRATSEMAQANLQMRMRTEARETTQGNARLGMESQRLALETKKFKMNEGAIESAAQSLANGDLTRLRDIASMRGESRILIYNMAKKLNPNFSIADTERKLKMEDYYANGKGANNLQSFGTFLEHAGEASDAVSSIHLLDRPAANKPLNWWRKNLSGSPEYQNLMGALEPVRKEFEGFLLGGRALYGDDRKQAEIILSEDSSPAQIQAALKRMGHTAKARFNEENYRYKRVMGKDLQDPFSEEAVAGAAKIGLDLGSKKETAASPGTVQKPTAHSDPLGIRK